MTKSTSIQMRRRRLIFPMSHPLGLLLSCRNTWISRIGQWVCLLANHLPRISPSLNMLHLGHHQHFNSSRLVLMDRAGRWDRA